MITWRGTAITTKIHWFNALTGKWALQDQELAFRQPGRGECCHMQWRYRVSMWDRCHISMWDRGCCRHHFSVCCWCPQRLPSAGCQNCHSWQLNSIGCPDPRFSICSGGAFLSLTCTPSISLQQPDMIHKHVSLCASGTLPIFCKKPHEPAKYIAHICWDDSERQPAAPSMLQHAPSPHLATQDYTILYTSWVCQKLLPTLTLFVRHANTGCPTFAGLTNSMGCR